MINAVARCRWTENREICCVSVRYFLILSSCFSGFILISFFVLFMVFTLSAPAVMLCWSLFILIVFDFVIIVIISLFSLSLFVFLPSLSLSLFESLLLLLLPSSLLFEKWFSPRGEILRSGVSFTSVVVFDKHVCGHCFGDQGHDGVLLELLWWCLICLRNFIRQLHILLEDLRLFFSKDFVSVVFVLDVIFK